MRGGAAAGGSPGRGRERTTATIIHVPERARPTQVSGITSPYPTCGGQARERGASERAARPLNLPLNPSRASLSRSPAALCLHAGVSGPRAVVSVAVAQYTLSFRLRRPGFVLLSMAQDIQEVMNIARSTDETLLTTSGDVRVPSTSAPTVCDCAENAGRQGVDGSHSGDVLSALKDAESESTEAFAGPRQGLGRGRGRAAHDRKHPVGGREVGG